MHLIELLFCMAKEIMLYWKLYESNLINGPKLVTCDRDSFLIQSMVKFALPRRNEFQVCDARYDRSHVSEKRLLYISSKWQLLYCIIT